MLRTYAAIIALVLVAPGCRSDPYADVREREWRRLEDQIYCLEGEVERLEAELDSCQRENDSLRGRGAVDAGSSERLPSPAKQPAGSSTDPNDSIDDLHPPRTEMGDESPPPVSMRRPRSKPGSVKLASAADSRTARHARRVPPFAAPTGTSSGETAGNNSADSSGTPVALVINPRLTGGDNTDGRYGDEGIMAVIEVRDATGNLVCDPGRMTLRVHDPLAVGDDSVVAEWGFSAAEVAQRFRQGIFGNGAHFELPWPNRPPIHDKLRLEVICEPVPGRRLAASYKFSVDLRRVASPAGSSAAKPAWSPTRD